MAMSIESKKEPVHYQLSRDLSDENISLLNFKLSNETWYDTLNESDPNEAAVNFMDTLIFYYDSICPKKKKKIKISKTRNRTPDTETRLLKEQLDLAYEIYKSGPENHSLLSKINDLRKKYHEKLRESHIIRNSNMIKSSDNISQSTWKIINSNKIGKTSTKEQIKLNVNGEIVSSSNMVANELNNYYVNLPKGNSSDLKEITLYSEKIAATMFLDPVTPQELLEIINTLKNKTSSGLDEISNVLLKKVGPNIVIPLCYMINLSFENGIFPDCLKNSKVVPLYKKGDKTIPIGVFIK
ncbi:putative RNA-directed DNA polymerase from transposon BS [Frankliniella fusca]|uniref:RNA-directed DNA polymerase from transposon BS n=1 Tax=Frankliniella fusca TaxID=407009 RepID=A0AAE1HN12_9NEOP|nr:putative RNA-directed DNA polymerase from transposon BS [Frankliniella fusca]